MTKSVVVATQLSLLDGNQDAPLYSTLIRTMLSPKDVSDCLSPDVSRCIALAAAIDAQRSRSKERSSNPHPLPFQSRDGSFSTSYSPSAPTTSIGAVHSNSSRGRVSFRADELLQTARNHQDSKESESIAGNGLHYLQNVHYRATLGQGSSFHSQHSRSSSQVPRGRQDVRREGMLHHESRSISLSRQSLVSPEYQSLLLSLEASPKPRSKSNHHVKDISRRHQLQRKVSSNSDDDSEIQFLKEYNVVQPSSSSTSLKACEDSSQEQNNHHVQSLSSDETAVVNENNANTIQISNSEYDPKSGRCVHHPHVRLRKKNLFGRGWKVLMTACPDCCIDELHRIRSINQNTNMKKQNQTFGISRRSSDNTAETAALTIDESSRSSTSNTKVERDISKTYSRVNSSSPQETFHVSKMPWIDPLNGQSGKYTGSINYNHVPHGSGSMRYDPNRLHPEAARCDGMKVAVVVVKAGEWKQGQFLGPKQR